MKYSLSLLWGLLLATTTAVAQSSEVLVSSSDSGRYLTDVSGLRLADGNLVWLGSFDGNGGVPITADTVIQPMSIADLMQTYQWTFFGETQTRSLMGNSGKISADVKNETSEARNFAGKQIFLWVFNAPTVEDATGYGLYSAWGGETLWTFAQIIPDRATISLNDTKLVAFLGSVSETNEVVLTTIVPEPAAYAAIFALGVLAVTLVRRQRKG